MDSAQKHHAEWKRFMWHSAKGKSIGPENRSVIAGKDEGIEMEEFGGWWK